MGWDFQENGEVNEALPTIGKGKLTLDELATAVTEVEMIVNSRPLSYFSTEDVEDLIAPSHLIAGRRLMSLPDGPYKRDVDDSVEIDHTDLNKRMLHLNKVLEHFWKRWKKEYLLELRESHRQTHKCPISIGDVVFVHEADRPRGFWKLARVEDLTDGLVRGACVQTHGRKLNSSIATSSPTSISIGSTQFS